MRLEREVATVLMMPALLITTLAHQIHNRNFAVIAFLDFLFYTLCFYGVFSIFSPRKLKATSACGRSFFKPADLHCSLSR
jgi:hypothetical protein